MNFELTGYMPTRKRADKNILVYMDRLLKKSVKKQGLPPGTLVFVGTQKMKQPVLKVIDLNKQVLTEKEVSDMREVEKFPNTDTVTWLNVDGAHDVGSSGKCCGCFRVEPHANGRRYAH